MKERRRKSANEPYSVVPARNRSGTEGTGLFEPRSLPTRAAIPTRVNADSRQRMTGMTNDCSRQRRLTRLQAVIDSGTRPAWQAPLQNAAGAVQTVVQRVNEPAEQWMPEAKQILRILTECTDNGALPSNVNGPPENSVDFLKSQLPSMPRDRIRAALNDFPVATEAWESMFLDPHHYESEDRSPLGGATIGGHRENWTVLGPLAQGSEARVMRGWGAKRPAAIKIFKGNTPAMEDAFSKEVDAHQKLQQLERDGIHIPNVVRMLDYNNLLRTIVMDLVPGRALDPDGREAQHVLEARDKALKETLAALSAQGYRLGDIQPRNTMYDEKTQTITFVDITLEKL